MAELGIQHFYISRSPLEGTQVTGSDKETAQRLQKFLSVQYEEWVSDKEMILGGELDRYGTRKNKRELLKAGFKTPLLPLPMPWKEITSFVLKRVIFANMITELRRNKRPKFKWGCELPSEFENWFDEDDKHMFPYLRGQNFEKQLAQLCSQRGYKSVAEFYDKMITRCYETLAGPMALDKFHMNQDEEDIRQMLKDIRTTDPDLDIEEERVAQMARIRKEQEDPRSLEETGEGEELIEEEASQEHVGEDDIRDRRLRRGPRKESRSRSRSRNRSRSRSRSRSFRSRSLEPNDQRIYTQEEWASMMHPSLLKSLH